MKAKKVLLIMQGIPASGKSTKLNDLGLSPYVLSTDKLRLLYNSPQMSVDGVGISQKEHKLVFETLYTALEERMKRGAFTIVDATHTKAKSLNQYRKLCKEYGYKPIVVRFDVDLEEAIQRNFLRGLSFVGKEVIERKYEELSKCEVPKFFDVITPEEIMDTIQYKLVDLSKYNNIWHIGDIHGCYTALIESIGEINEKDFYIFVGDYVDRGLENYEVLQFLLKIKDLPNVILLRGNHEKHLENYANDNKRTGKSWRHTEDELEVKGIDKKELRILCRKFRDVFAYMYNEKIVLTSHGGVPYYPENITLINGEQFVKGVGGYDVDIDNLFTTNCLQDNIYQIHGHRNLHELEIKASEQSFNLEGRVEFGGYLRICKLNDFGFDFLETKNDVFKVPDEVRMLHSDEDFIEVLRNDEDVLEKQFGNISSFNFKNDVFFNKAWTEKNEKARGVFVNTKTNCIVARGYEKFFNLNELPETSFEAISKLNFPLNGYLKENGYLGLVGYDEEVDKLVFASKSSLDSKHAKWLKELFEKTVDEVDLYRIKDSLRENNSCLVFEVLREDSPHIIEVEEDKLILLDVIYRTPKFQRFSYKELVEFGKDFNIQVKQKALTFKNIDAFKSWFEKAKKYDYQYKGKNIEGFVFEDMDSFLFKTKLGYYNFWKQLRTVKDLYQKFESNQDSLDKYIKSKSGLSIHPEDIERALEFGRFLKEVNKPENLTIVELREMFESDEDFGELASNVEA